MFGLKWLWKTNRGSNIDTSNFVSKEFLNTTLQDYVNRDLLNTTLSNELANYVSTTTLNNTLNNYVLNSSLNTTLSSYVQTNTLNTTLSNYVQSTTLNNYVSTNTAQTITGSKTFTEGVVINKTPVPLTLKATDNNKTYIVYKDSANNSNLSIGANAASTSIEVNRGDLTIQTQQDNKTVAFETGTIKTNRARLEFGTEINAGYGGGVVKFIPEDNSTKTLQFFNNNATDQRRFKLAVPEPVDNNNPATKNYVDTKKTEATNYTDTKITETRNYIDTQISGINMVNSISSQTINLQVQSSNATKVSWGQFTKETIKVATQQNVKVLSAVAELTRAGGTDINQNLNEKVEFSYSINNQRQPEIYLNFVYLPNSNVGDSGNTNWLSSKITIWYVSSINTLIDDPFYIVQREENNEN